MPQHLEGPVRVRFAPSPTGFLHVGGARTAIYNDLLRQRVGGANILRIEDTDRERSSDAMTRQIQSALAWLGIEYDEGPFLQSGYVERHRQRAHELLAAGKAYRCFCSPETLDAGRAEAEAKKVTYRYPRTCLQLPAGEAERRAAAGEPHVVRFRWPDKAVGWNDLVRGPVEFGAEALDDFVILRSDGSPIYHLSVVCDDIDMGVTVVIRGEDHISNTPKHIPLFEAFGAPVPVFGHLPLILGTDRKRLSKRTGATSVEEFRAAGILPQALYNYLALLGWNAGDDREVMSREEMCRVFSTERLNSSAAIFDVEKLEWMNAQYMSALPVEELLAAAAPFLAEAGVASADVEAPRLRAAIELHRTRARTLKTLATMVEPYFRDEIPYDAALAGKFAGEAGVAEHLDVLAARWEALATFDKATSEAELRTVAAERGVKAGVLIHPTRFALSGQTAGPSLFDMVETMGREASVRHLRRLAATLRGLTSASLSG